MKKYAERFQKEEIDMKTLPLLTEAHLEKLGVNTIGARLTILAGIAARNRGREKERESSRERERARERDLTPSRAPVGMPPPPQPKQVRTRTIYIIIYMCVFVCFSWSL
jgi:hypothetical protein